MKTSGAKGELGFNPAPSTIMHIDLNSCFATIEQQANPHLRGKPIAVAAYTTPSGCIVAPSIEAKRYGIKVGMRVKEGRLLYPNLIVLPPDPAKYRNVHLALRRLISDYTADFTPKSIDEFVLNLEGYLSLPLKEAPYKVVAQCNKNISLPMYKLALDIKRRIKEEIGEWLTVSIGIAPNRFLAKTAAGLHKQSLQGHRPYKPDGLDEINKTNFLNIYSSLSLMDLCGIKLRNATRLNSFGIYSVLDFYRADIRTLMAAFSSIVGYYWYLRLRGWRVDDVEFGRRSYGNSFALPKPLALPQELSPILSKLVTKMGARLRQAGYKARGIHVAIFYRDGSFWHKGVTFPKVFFDSRDIYREAYKIMCNSSHRKPVRELAVSCFNLIKSSLCQLELFEDIERKERLVSSIDKINERWGHFIITPARMLNTKDVVLDRIAFGAAGPEGL